MCEKDTIKYTKFLQMSMNVLHTSVRSTSGLEKKIAFHDATSRPEIASREFLTPITDDVLIIILEFAAGTFHELLVLSESFARVEFLVRNRAYVLRPHLNKLRSFPSTANPITAYRALLQDEINFHAEEARLLDELRARIGNSFGRRLSFTLSSFLRSVAFGSVKEPIDISTRLICNLGSFPSREVSEAVSRRRWFAMTNVVLYSGEKLLKLGEHGRTSFMTAPRPETYVSQI